MPTLPVDPRTATPIVMPFASLADLQPYQTQRHHRRRGGDTVDPIQHSAMTGKQPAAILQMHVALQQALAQVADDRKAGRGQAQTQKTQRRRSKPAYTNRGD